jgi:hypothetical protein
VRQKVLEHIMWQMLVGEVGKINVHFDR